MAFDVYDPTKNSKVNSNDMKLGSFVKKFTAGILKHTKSSMSIEFTRYQITMTYEKILVKFRSELYTKFPPEIFQVTQIGLSINEITRGNSIST